jgi:hypothetical protein
MKNLKLTIDLLPKGAWGNNLSKTLPRNDWDAIRRTVYKVANNKCSICGRDGELHAHEIWKFDIPTKTQTLENIVALCPACHGVKHFRHSQMIGYGEQSKQHFLNVNKCDIVDFLIHKEECEKLFNEQNAIDEWTVKAPILDEVGIEY